MSNWFSMAVGAAAGSEAEDGLESILIGLAAVILNHRAAQKLTFPPHPSKEEGVSSGNPLAVMLLVWYHKQPMPNTAFTG